MDEAPGEPVRDRGFKARKREDHALVLIEDLKQSLHDIPQVPKILRELGRYYDPVLGGAIMEVGHQRAIVLPWEAGRQAEALALIQQRYELYLAATGLAGARCAISQATMSIERCGRVETA